MEFSSDIAILQSALQLANQRSTLSSYTKQSLAANVKTVSLAIEEVCSGIYHKSTAADYNWKKLKLTTVLLYKVLLADIDVSVDAKYNEELQQWHILLYGLPNLSWPFVFDVIANSGLWQQLFKVLQQLPDVFAVKLLQHLLQYFLEPGESIDIRMLSIVLAYISFHWKSPIYSYCNNQQSSDEHDCTKAKQQTARNKNTVSNKLINELSSMRLPSLGNVNSEELSNLISAMLSGTEALQVDVADNTSASLLMMSLLHTTVALFCNQTWILSPIHCDSNTSHVDERLHGYCNPLTAMMDLLLSDDTHKDNALQIIISEIRGSDLPLQLRKLHVSIEDVSPQLDKLLKQFLSRCTGTMFDELKQFQLDSFLTSSRDTQIYQYLWEHLYEQLIIYDYGLLRVAVQNMSINPQGINLSEILNKLKFCVSRIHEKWERELAAWQRPDEKLAKTVVMLRYQISGAREYLMWLLEERDVSMVTQPRWVEALVLSRPLLLDPCIMLCAIKQLAWFKEMKISASLMLSLKNIILESFSDCDTKTKNTILHQLAGLYISSELEEMFLFDESASNELRVTLNRLTTETLTDGVSKIASLCMQSPCQVVQVILHCVVQNRGQVDTIVQVFRHLPTMVHFQVGDSNVLITTLINMTVDDMTVEGQNNLASFCKQLLQPYPKADDAELQNPVLAPKQLLHNLVLPAILPSSVTESQKMRRVLCFQLLRASVDVLHELSAKWISLISETRPVFVLCILLRMLDSFMSADVQGAERTSDTDFIDNHLTGVEAASRADWLECLILLIETLEIHCDLISDCDLVWLREQLVDCHWTTKCYCCELYTRRGISIEANIEIPYKVFNLVNLPLRQSPVSDNEYLALFQFITISDLTMNMATCNLRKDTNCSPESLLTEITLAMAVVLPQCTGTELCRLVKFLCHWLDADSSSIKEMISGETNTSTGVCCCLLIKLAINLIGSGVPEDNSVYSWTNLAVTVTLAIKVIILNQISEPVAFWDACQCFIILCQVLSDWPDTGSAQHILTLELDIIGQLDLSIQQYKKSWSHKAANEISEVLSALRSECSNIAASELQEPLVKVLDGICL